MTRMLLQLRPGPAAVPELGPDFEMLQVRALGRHCECGVPGSHVHGANERIAPRPCGAPWARVAQLHAHTYPRVLHPAPPATRWSCSSRRRSGCTCVSALCPAQAEEVRVVPPQVRRSRSRTRSGGVFPSSCCRGGWQRGSPAYIHPL